MAAPANRVVIGLDYGTTYTGVAFEGVGQAARGEYHQVMDWPGGRSAAKVPSDISYTLSETTRQWGGDFSVNSLRLICTKLELDVQKTGEELVLILGALKRTNNLDYGTILQSDGLPSYPAMDSEEIVANYLERVREYLWRDLLNTFGEVLLENVPIDLVITVPATWSESAKNRTFRAVCKAGFDNLHFKGLREIIMISEPEAATISIMKTVRPLFGQQGILPGDSIVVCDAGGGTVDLISYKVRQTEPALEIGEVAFGSGDRCGAVFIDRSFKQWLWRKLGEHNFRELSRESPFGSIEFHSTVEPLMAPIMERFEEIKRRFAGIGGRGEETIALPHPLHNLTIPGSGIDDGEILITEQDLRDMFHFSVNGVIRLIRGQLSSVEFAGSRVKYVFLSGGFAASEHLRHEVEQFLRPRGIQIGGHRDNAWSEVVRGAVFWGIKGDHNKMVYVRKCWRNYGVSVSEPFSSFKHSEADAYIDDFDGERKAKEQMIWLIKKGDAIFSNEPKLASISLRRKFGRRDPKIFRTSLVSSDDDNSPQRLVEVPIATRIVTPLIYDFSDIPENQLTRVEGIQNRRSYYLVNFDIEIQVQSKVEIKVTCNGRVIGKHTL